MGPDELIAVACPACQKELKAKPKWVGKRARCSKCGHRFEILAPDEPTSLLEKEPPSTEQETASAGEAPLRTEPGIGEGEPSAEEPAVSMTDGEEIQELAEATPDLRDESLEDSLRDATIPEAVTLESDQVHGTESDLQSEEQSGDRAIEELLRESELALQDFEDIGREIESGLGAAPVDASTDASEDASEETSEIDILSILGDLDSEPPVEVQEAASEVSVSSEAAELAAETPSAETSPAEATSMEVELAELEPAGSEAGEEVPSDRLAGLEEESPTPLKTETPVSLKPDATAGLEAAVESRTETETAREAPAQADQPRWRLSDPHRSGERISIGGPWTELLDWGQRSVVVELDPDLSGIFSSKDFDLLWPNDEEYAAFVVSLDDPTEYLQTQWAICYLHHPRVAVRLETLSLLGDRYRLSVGRSLIELLEDESADVCTAASEALWHKGPLEVAHALRQLKERGRQGPVQRLRDTCPEEYRPELDEIYQRNFEQWPGGIETVTVMEPEAGES